MIFGDMAIQQSLPFGEGIRSMVATAIEAGRVDLAFQPVVEASRPERIAYHEGLIRLFNPQGGIIPADDFMAAVETNELGRRLDRIALERGLEALRRNPGLRISLNMSVRSIGDADWTSTLSAGLERDATAAERLIIEITERSAIMFPGYVASFMEKLQGLGISFALDDFGAGYTSFRQLRDLRFDIIKIDGTFCRGIHSNADNRVLAEALIGIGRHFDCLTVGEMIETAEDAALLTGLGVDCLQGWLFGAPVLRPDWTAVDFAVDHA
jgi:EAL domain-containing protein (putative c-di-GMP-specific phosphodiesterase class I)